MRTGKLDIVGLGPGAAAHRTHAAATAVRDARTVIGCGPYVEQCADLLSGEQTVISGPIGEEPRRALEALGRAVDGERVALVCSGDAGVYGMAARTLALAAELPDERRPEIRVVPGITAATAAAALLGAPLADDFAVVSLSDLQRPWDAIERRLDALAASGIALCLYNPRSRTRTWQLPRVLELLRDHRPPTTAVAVVTHASRAGQQIVRTTLEAVEATDVTMSSIVIVAGDSAAEAGGWLVAERTCDREPVA